jgi:hypothetical protein
MIRGGGGGEGGGGTIFFGISPLISGFTHTQAGRSDQVYRDSALGSLIHKFIDQKSDAIERKE